MQGTRDVVRALAQANPEATLTEDKVRWVLRRGLIPAIRRVAGRLVWSRNEIETLARLLDLRPPALDDVSRLPASIP